MFFSNPLDLDLMMLQQFPDAYGVETADREAQSSAVVTAVLGKTGDPESYQDVEKKLFAAYHHRFKLGSKPARHVAALAVLNDTTLSDAMPEPIRRLTERINAMLGGLPK